MELNFFLAILAALFCRSEGYAILNSVSWAVGNDADGELVNSNEEAAPALLVDAGNIWKQDIPSSVYDSDADKRPEPLLQTTKDLKQTLAAPRMFSYRIDGMKRTTGAPPALEEAAKTARYTAHYSDWGFLATISTLDTIKGVPLGKVFAVSDGTPDNSTGVPYFYVSERDNAVADLRNSPFASLTFPDAQGMCRYLEEMLCPDCREKARGLENPRCVRLTLTGQVMDVGKEEVEFAKEAIFSRHPAMRAWPAEYRWFFLKLSLEQVWLQNWVGGASLIPLQEYLKATPH